MLYIGTREIYPMVTGMIDTVHERRSLPTVIYIAYKHILHIHTTTYLYLCVSVCARVCAWVYVRVCECVLCV